LWYLFFECRLLLGPNVWARPHPLRCFCFGSKTLRFSCFCSCGGFETLSVRLMRDFFFFQAFTLRFFCDPSVVPSLSAHAGLSSLFLGSSPKVAAFYALHCFLPTTARSLAQGFKPRGFSFCHFVVFFLVLLYRKEWQFFAHLILTLIPNDSPEVPLESLGSPFFFRHIG